MRLFLSGDVMTGRGIDQALPYSVAPGLHEQYVKDARIYKQLAAAHSGPIPDHLGYDYIWGDALEVLDREAPDARVINLETAVTTSDDHWTEKRIHYRMHPRNIPLLKEAGIDVCILSNNHVLDWGQKGLAETLKVLKEAGIQTAGAGDHAVSAAAPAVLNTSSGRLLVFGYGVTDSGIPGAWMAGEKKPGINLLHGLGDGQIERVITHINRFRKKGDRVMLSIHWGGNWGYNILLSHRKFAHKLIDAGSVDLIHGHSSHHPKGMEVYKGHLVLYGCGDLVNDYEGIGGYEAFRDELSLLYFPHLDSSGQLAALRLIPMKMHRFRLHNAEEEDVRWLMDRLNRVCKELETSVTRSDDGTLLLRW